MIIIKAVLFRQHRFYVPILNSHVIRRDGKPVPYAHTYLSCVRRRGVLPPVIETLTIHHPHGRA